MHVQMPQKQVHMLQFLDSLLTPSKSLIRALRAEGKTLRVLTKKRSRFCEEQDPFQLLYNTYRIERHLSHTLPQQAM